MHWRRKWQATPVFLPGESQGRQSLVGCRLWGRTESDATEVTYRGSGSGGKESACNVDDPGWITGLGDPLEKELATHSSILAWEVL